MQPQENLTQKNAETPKQETITELAARHMENENHTTTDEELKNARLELNDEPVADESLYEIDNTTILPPLPGETEDKGDSDDNGETSPVPNPYDVLR